MQTGKKYRVVMIGNDDWFEGYIVTDDVNFITLTRDKEPMIMVNKNVIKYMVLIPAEVKA